jgi:glucose dehydrogenase
MLVAAILILRNRPGGLILYALGFIVSIIWAIYDAGWAFWPLFSRLFTFAVLAFLAALLWPFMRARQTVKPVNKSAFSVAAILAVLLLVSIGGMFKTWNVISQPSRLPLNRFSLAVNSTTGSTGAIPPMAIDLRRLTRSTNRMSTSCKSPG